MQSSSQTNLAAVAEFLSAHQQSDETPLQFKTRLQKAQDRVDDLNIRFSDVTVSRFLTGLSSEYDGFRNAMIAANKDYTLDELYQQLLQYQSAVAISEDSVKAHVARKSPGKSSSSSSSLSSSSSPTESPVTADAARILAETFANFLNGSAKGGQNRKRKRGDQSSKPKQKYCDHCKMSGHWTSECRKLQTERSNSNEKSKSRDQGDKKNKKKKVKMQLAITGRAEEQESQVGHIYTPAASARSAVITAPTSSDRGKKKKNDKKQRQSLRAYSKSQEVSATFVSHKRSSASPLRAYLSASSSRGRVKFYIDSGASRTCVSKYVPTSLLQNYTTDSTVIHTYDGQLRAKGTGFFGSVPDVLHTPADCSLLSVGQVCGLGYVMVFDGKECRLLYPEQVYTKGQPMFTAPLKDGLYEVSLSPDDLPPATAPLSDSDASAGSAHSAATPTTASPMSVDGETAHVTNVVCENKFTLWHNRFGHFSTPIMSNFRADSLYYGKGVYFSKRDVKNHQQEVGICTGCALGKMHHTRVRRHPIVKK